MEEREGRVAVVSPQLLFKLNNAWAATPQCRFGQLIESVENIAWEMLERDQQRNFSTRLLYLPDHYFEAALDQWISIPFQRKVVGS